MNKSSNRSGRCTNAAVNLSEKLLDHPYAIRRSLYVRIPKISIGNG